MLAATLDAAPASPTVVIPPPASLREIGRVRASVCASIVAHANMAIVTTLANDQTMATSIKQLRSVDLESNEMYRSRGLDQLNATGSKIRRAAIDSQAEVDRLRGIAKETADPLRQAELRNFADSLADAINRQKKAGVDLQRFVTIIEGRSAGLDVGTSFQGFERIDDGNFRANHFNQTAREAAADFVDRLPKIAEAESHAADHTVGAVNGCQ
jgi:hypothetical protein